MFYNIIYVCCTIDLVAVECFIGSYLKISIFIWFLKIKIIYLRS